MTNRRALALILALYVAAPHSAAAQTQQQAQRFVQEIYASYAAHSPDGSSTDYLNKYASQAFTPHLAYLIHHDRRGNEIGLLDRDPFCDCQDSDGINVIILPVRVLSRRRALSYVHIQWDGRSILATKAFA